MFPLKQQITLRSTAGLHATLASKIVFLTSKYNAKVEIEYADTTIDAKSILGLISLAIPSGENLTVITHGEDAEQAMNELKKLLG